MRSPAVLVIIVAVLLICMVALAAGFLLVHTRLAQAAEQPLVLIDTPAHNARVWLDRATPVLTTARSANDIARVELWVNGQLYENRPATYDGLTTFTTAFVWQPQQPGIYTIVARAFDGDGNSGQATVVVEAVEETPADEPPVPPPPEEEGSLPGYGSDPGSEEAPPEEAPPTEEPPPEAPSGEAPDPDPEGPADEVVDLGVEAGDMVSLTLEAVRLDASADYHNINCYFTVNADPPHTEQVTFEKTGGGLPWSTTGTAIATFPWPADRPLPVRVECTGISPPAAGEPLGEPTEDAAPPEVWDGRDLHLAWTGAYDFIYRIQPRATVASEDIPAPTDLRIETELLSPLKRLCWNWPGEEDIIDGFRMYLNDSLQWRVADPTARCTYLPPAWTEPSCGQLFHFQVTAYQGDFPGGAESPPGTMAPLGPEAGRCGSVFRLTFEEIEFTPLDYAADLPDVADGDGMAGPLYGYFSVAGTLLPFDTVHVNGEVGGVRVEGGEHSALADTLFAASNRYHQHSVVFQWDNEWGAVTLLNGAIMDYDWGESDSRDDILCNGETVFPAPPADGDSGTLECLHGGATDVAHVTYTIEELPEWPEGEAPPGAASGVPRPELSVLRWWLAGDRLAIHIGNEGLADAVGDMGLLVELEEGTTLGTYTVPFGDSPLNGEWNGRMATYELPDHTFASLQELCSLQVTVDPGNAYLEYDEGNNTTTTADLERIAFHSTDRPSMLEAEVNVLALYLTCHADAAAVRAIPLVDGTEAVGFTVEMSSITYGLNTRTLHVAYTGADPLTTDGWRLEMFDLVTSEVFNSTEIEETQEWTP